MKNYKVCSNCVLDTTDPNIKFDERGVCDLCNDYNNTIKPTLDYVRLKKELTGIVEKVKKMAKIMILIVCLV